MSTLETLKAAREKIANPDRWIQGDYARNLLGKKVGPLSKNAFCFCAIGALCVVTRKGTMRIAFDHAMQFLQTVITEELIHEFNDSHDHAEVIAVFDKAIARLEGK